LWRDNTRAASPPGARGPDTAFVTSVKAILAAGEGQRDLLVKAGMAPTLLEDLAKMVSDFEAASEAARTARRDHIGARADLEVITAELVEQVKLLDGITRYRFGNDPELMAEWKAARQLLGQARNGQAPPTPPAGDVKQAA